MPPPLAPLQNGKPAPDCFTAVAQRLGLPPSACLVIEDAPAGVAAATAAGMRVVAVPSILQKGGRPSDLYAKPCPGAAAGCVSILPSLLEFRPERYGLPPFEGGWGQGRRVSCSRWWQGFDIRLGFWIQQSTLPQHNTAFSLVPAHSLPDRIGETIPMHPVLHLRGTVVPGFGRGSRELGECGCSLGVQGIVDMVAGLFCAGSAAAALHSWSVPAQCANRRLLSRP